LGTVCLDGDEIVNDSYPPGAFIIINSQVFPLDKEVINMGRGPANDLVINDPSVSRQHAQLVANRGCYLISDLNSASGTYINGESVRQRKVHSGDIIALAGVSMLYVENQPKLISALWEETRPPDPV
jgi:pSer/pThr/pTyr-binding forkhead associated (FHA) protein